MLDVEIVTDKDRQTVILNGCLDGLTAPEFGEKMKDKLDDITMLILDLKDLTYISSAGLREILTLQQVMEEQGEMVVKNVNDLIMDVFEASGFDTFLTIEES
jgi:anti-sigma B factor antagonist